MGGWTAARLSVLATHDFLLIAFVFDVNHWRE
jgi:hypothetical protein